MCDCFKVSTDEFYPHQRKYYDALCKKKEKKRNFHSIISIPTGGGKTRLAATYVINEELVPKKRRILWLAHSHYLLDQAYDVFKKISKEKLSDNNMLLVYSQNKKEEYTDERIYRNIGNIEDAKNGGGVQRYDVVIASFQSVLNHLKRTGCKESSWGNHLDRLLGEDVCIVVDEAHHLGAVSYHSLLECYAKEKTLLGLSATPVRADLLGNFWITRMLLDDLKVTVSMTELIAQKHLVKPVFEEVPMSFRVRDEEKYPSWDDYYNHEIYQRYVDGQDKYGKTVIFAKDIDHADALYKVFKDDNNLRDKVFEVHSRLDDREKQFAAFSDENNKDGILINVNVMNEGVDVPSIKTVFFTKRIESPIIITQCIGRAMRTFEGKEEAYVVNFAVPNIGDKWYSTTPKVAFELYELAYCVGIAAKVRKDKLQVEEDLNKKVHDTFRHSSVSIDELCLAGYYDLGFEEDRFLLLVTYSEHLVIEKCTKNQEVAKLPTKFFFDNRPEVQQNVREAIAYGTCDFISYDDKLLQSFKKLQESVLVLYNKYFCDHYSTCTFSDLDNEIVDLFKKIKSDGRDLWIYLNCVGVYEEETFALVVWNTFVDLKYEQRNFPEVVPENVDFSGADWIAIDEVKPLEQHLDVKNWLSACEMDFSGESSKTIGTIRERLENGILGFDGMTGNFNWADILKEKIANEYERIIKEIIPTLKCCKNNTIRKVVEEGLRKMVVQIHSWIGYWVKDKNAYIGKILYSQLVEDTLIENKVSDWLNRVYDFSSLNHESKSKIQDIVNYIFEEGLLNRHCYKHNLEMLKEKIIEVCAEDRSLSCRENVLTWYYTNVNNFDDDEKKAFEKDLNKVLFLKFKRRKNATV